MGPLWQASGFVNAVILRQLPAHSAAEDCNMFKKEHVFMFLLLVVFLLPFLSSVTRTVENTLAE